MCFFCAQVHPGPLDQVVRPGNGADRDPVARLVSQDLARLALRDRLEDLVNQADLVSQADLVFLEVLALLDHPDPEFKVRTAHITLSVLWKMKVLYSCSV